MVKIKENIKKVFTKELLFYAVFGIMTTIINLVTFYILANILKVNENVSNFLAIVLAVLFAYFTNKDLVFHAEAVKIKDRVIQFTKFIAGRTFTMLVELIGGMILFKLPIPNMISKTFLTVVVIILNFFISKFFAFSKRKLL